MSLSLSELVAVDILFVDPRNEQPIGRYEPGAKLLRKLAAHGCNVHWLLTGEGDVYADASSGRERDAEEREILRVLRSEGIRDARTLKSLLADIRRMFDIRSRIAKRLDQ